MDKEATSNDVEDGDDDSSSTSLMEPHTRMKMEIKEEDLDDINPECLLTVHKLEDLAGLEHDLQTETQPPSSPTLSCKEKTEHIAEEKEKNHDSDFPTTRLMDLHAIVKKEIKEEDLDDFLPECLLTVHKLEDQAGLEHDFKTEIQPPSSPTLSRKEETEHVEENHDNDFPTTRQMVQQNQERNVDKERPHHKRPQCRKTSEQDSLQPLDTTEVNRHEDLQCSQTSPGPSAVGIDQGMFTGDMQRTQVIKEKVSMEQRDCEQQTNPRSHLRKPSDQEPSQQLLKTKKNQFECPQCSKLISGRAAFAYHQLIHTGEKPYPCDTCGKGFRSPTDLSAHKIIHTGHKPHRCSQCGKAFNYKSGLRVHQRIHTGEKLHGCGQCGKSFRHTSSLKRHQALHIRPCWHRNASSAVKIEEESDVMEYGGGNSLSTRCLSLETQRGGPKDQDPNQVAT